MATYLCRRHLYLVKVCLQRHNIALFSESASIKPSKTCIPETISDYRHVTATDIIDVRTPEEFKLDHIPGAINVPVLKDDERVIVGTMYKTDQFRARKVGAAIIGRNISEHLEKYFETKAPEYSPLIYCWRGGQRSYSMALVLAQIGFRTFVLDEGYKGYRKQVQVELSSLPNSLQFRCIAGLTGSGKTHILAALKSRGEQILDLEALAKHKGSVLGLWHGETQPSQKYWESVLSHELQQFSPAKPVWVESESRRIGYVTVPNVLFTRLCKAPRFHINLPMEERVKHIMESYTNWAEDREALKEIVSKLVRVQGHKLVNEWLQMIDEVRGEEFVESMLVNHYDPSYTLSQKKNNQSDRVVQVMSIANLSEKIVDNLVSELISHS